MEAVPAKTVDEYLAGLPEAERVVLEELRRTIRAAAPEAEEVISYRIPIYKLYGPLVHFHAAKNHCSLVTVNKSILKDFASQLEGFKTSGTTIRFSPENPLPSDLVTAIVKARVRENRAGKAGYGKG